jgi:hypothetical protein
MRGAFVLRLGPETDPSDGRFEGWVEEVDSSAELRFHSTGELLTFLGERFRTALQSRHSGGNQHFNEGTGNEEET